MLPHPLSLVPCVTWVLLLVSWLALAILPTPCSALIQTLSVDHDDRAAFHIQSFGFEPGGQFILQLQSFKLYVPSDAAHPPHHIYHLAFVLERSATDGGLRLQGNTDINNPADLSAGNTYANANMCFHENKRSTNATIFSLAERISWNSTFTETIEIGGYYHLYFSNCIKDSQVEMELTLTEYNLDTNNRRIYLSAGEASLPTWFFVLCGVFVAEFVIWSGVLLKHRSAAKSIHYLMLLVVFLKIMSLLFQSLRYHSLKYTGLHDGFFIAFYIFSFLKGMLMFSVIVLIGTGWSYLKPFLTDRDKQIMVGVLVAQALVNTAMVVLDEMSPGSSTWLTWRDVLYLMDMICCCVILVPIVWSVRALRDAAQSETRDGRALRNMERLKSFRTFYLLVVSFIYFTRIIVYLLSATLPFELSWMSTVFSEIASALFYATTGYLFRPQSKNPYLPLNQDQEDQEQEQDEDEALMAEKQQLELQQIMQ